MTVVAENLGFGEGVGVVRTPPPKRARVERETRRGKT